MGCGSSKPSATSAAVPPPSSSRSAPTNHDAQDAKTNHDPNMNNGTHAAAPNIATKDAQAAHPDEMSCSGTCTIGNAPTNTTTNNNNNNTNNRTTTTIHYAALSHRGRDPEATTKPNQDCYSVHESFLGSNGSQLFAVYDGHGPHGELCSQYVRDQLPTIMQFNLTMMTKQQAAKSNNNNNINNNTTTILSREQIQFALLQAHVECNDDLRNHPDIDDSYSGTTAISVYCHDDHRITISNVGDSRCILGTRNNNNNTNNTKITAVPLSHDQTPYRKEEAKRCIQAGARILSMGQIDPSTHHDGDEDVEDPPRVWHAHGNFPGTAFTRSLGDSVAQTLGVFAEPELLTVQVSANESMIVLASDGIFDVLSNQQVVDLCQPHLATYHARAACQSVLDQSRHEWMLQEECLDHPDQANYDDMTMICLFLQHDHHHPQAQAPEPPTTNTNTDDAQPQQPPPEIATTVPESTSNLHNSEAHPHKRRIRQKTLRNLEDMAGSTTTTTTTTTTTGAASATASTTTTAE